MIAATLLAVVLSCTPSQGDKADMMLGKVKVIQQAYALVYRQTGNPNARAGMERWFQIHRDFVDSEGSCKAWLAVHGAEITNLYHLGNTKGLRVFNQ